MHKRLLTGMILLSFLLIFSACGTSGEKENAAPPNAVITISPTAHSFDIAGAQITSTEFFNIVVKTAGGIPLEDVALRISFVWADPSSTGLVQLYDGDTPVNSPFYAKTDENGSYIVRFDFEGGGLAYSGTLLVISGSVTKTADFEVEDSSL